MNSMLNSYNSVGFNGRASLVYHDKKHLEASLKHIETVKKLNSLECVKKSNKNLYVAVYPEYALIKAGDNVEQAGKRSNPLYSYASPNAKSIIDSAKYITYQAELFKKPKPMKSLIDIIASVFFPS